MTTVHITMTGVTCRFGERIALDAMTLDLSARRIGIVGRNGSGKSTLARALCGLIAPDQGSVRVNGVDVLTDRRAAINTVGILFQNPDHQIIFPTVREEIAFGLRQQGRSKAAAETEVVAILARFGKSDWLARSVSTLSQGQRHLVCLMSVLAMTPSLVVLDEPFAGLDIPTSRALRRHFDAAEPALVHITHDPATIAHYEQVLWIDEGRIVQSGDPAYVLPAYIAAMEAADAGADL